MKVLINKANPAIKITAPEVEVYDKYYYIKNARLGILQELWTLIEEEFPKIISDEKMEQMGEEISKAAVDNIKEQFNKIVEEEQKPEWSEVALEKAAAEYATYKFEDTETLDTLRKHDFKAGAKWQKKQDELTWVDIQNIYIIATKQIKEAEKLLSKDIYPGSSEELFTKVLKKYKEEKK